MIDEVTFSKVHIPLQRSSCLQFLMFLVFVMLAKEASQRLTLGTFSKAHIHISRKLFAGPVVIMQYENSRHHRWHRIDRAGANESIGCKWV